MAISLKVIIIGAGVTGLSLAQGLKKQGIDFEIYERTSSAARHRDWGITVHWAVEFLELYPDYMADKLREAQVVTRKNPKLQEHVEFHDGETGAVFKHIPLGAAKRYSQKKVRQVLLEGIPIQYNMEFKSFKVLPGGIEGTFADGTTTKGTFLVACDGARSSTRQLLFDNKEDAKWKRIPGLILNNYWMQYTKEQALKVRAGLSEFMDIAVHPNGTYYGLIPLDIDDEKSPEEWKFQVFMSFAADLKPQEDTPEKRFALVKEKGKAFTEPFSTAIEYMPEDTIITCDHYGTWETRPWNSHGGRVLLAGDGAHSMTPHRAQGANHALQDVINLVRAFGDFKEGKLDEKALANNYMKEVVDRGSNEVRMSLKQGLAAHDWANNKDMPIVKIGSTPLHIQNSSVPLPTQDPNQL
ncbi:uncharacterized protein Z519_02615 [Cladophialophora bantiana CBS 173.52]|uniref:FAD-binding domain-containing protein n=1 Tax=Cladophialophora bantiana (strain ATCC 10958 / CBS 173.52 / CDC B-1940 / NIH 8579) TaxID=1442370 RepID=A0A0D2HV27_CLAB1|nr:uncharacterized protein Z519_02615 [Cladophialophora bantiana CBS 173.52]KIW97223.1 hypothetical protein Z519_02615 [Cladophialophora bantiana CBS 173.52]